MKTAEAFIEGLRDELQRELPGRESQFRMAPDIRLENNHEQYRNAAVLILLYQRSGMWHLVLQKRTEYPGAHSGQVGLPGGLHENVDGDLGITALRETREETGIDDGKIVLLGNLSKLEIPVSGIEVTPFVGYYAGSPVFRPEPEEVSYLIEVPLSELLLGDNLKTEIRTINNRAVRVPYYHLADEQVWGATAMMLTEFIDVLGKLDEV